MEYIGHDNGLITDIPTHHPLQRACVQSFVVSTGISACTKNNAQTAIIVEMTIKYMPYYGELVCAECTEGQRVERTRGGGRLLEDFGICCEYFPCRRSVVLLANTYLSKVEYGVLRSRR